MYTRYSILCVGILGLTLLVSSCQQGQQEKIESLSQRVDSLELELFDVKLDMIKVNRLLPSSAEMNPGAEGYSVVPSRIGPWAFVVEETRPRASGSVVTLSVGNLTGSYVTRIEFEVGYRPIDTSDFAMEYTSLAIEEGLSPTVWRKREVQLPNVRPSELGKISVSVNSGETRLVPNYRGATP
jgi:hypothetical protein